MLQRLMMMLFIGICASPVTAQSGQSNGYPKYELFAGYSANGYFVDESTTSAPPGQKVSSFFTDRAGGQKGFEISLDRNFNRYIGLKGDFSAYFETLHPRVVLPLFCIINVPCNRASAKVPLHSFYFTVGPEFKLRNSSPVTPFAHVLVGGVASHARFVLSNSIFAVSDSSTRTGFASSAGGGIDVRITERMSLRTAIDYTATFLPEPNRGEGRPQNHVRTSVGIVFHFH